MKAKGRQKSMQLKYLFIIIVCVVGIFVSCLMGSDQYAQRILLLILLWAAASSSFNIISGYGGQVVFGYMMFIGTGAYTTVLLFKFLGISPWLGMWIGAVIASFFALIIGLPTLRLHGAYFAIATVAFPLIAIPILNYIGLEEVSIPFTGHGAESMQFTDIRYYVLIAAILLALILIIVQTVESSRFGYALRALREKEAAAEGMGINTYWTKMMGFILSSAMGALMGALYPFSVLYILTSSSVYGFSIIVRIIGISIVGGLATVWGPVISAAFLVPLGEFANSQFGDRYPGAQDIIYGGALIAAILYMPQGIWGKIQRALHNRARKLELSRKPVTTEDSKRTIIDNIRSQGSFQFESVHSKIVSSNTNDPIFKVDGIYKSFGGVLALRDVNMEVPRNKILGIIGPNGSGKTTLFNVINGYLTPEKGRIFLEGKDVTDFKPHALCKLGIGRTFQIPQIFSRMTVLENITIGAFNRWRNVAKAHAIAEEIVQQMGLSTLAYDQPVSLTIWQTKILELSRALATQPKLLLLDEPMAGLNPEETEQMGEIIKMITAQSGITIIVIEHVLQTLVKIVDWMVGLDNGKKVVEGTCQEVISDPHIIEAYLGAKWRERHVRS
jgi:ABC-type branched-subunit amino acid transport system ATPase component/ABC-type branched-subunit amino acid transport system permease subunit